MRGFRPTPHTPEATSWTLRGGQPRPRVQGPWRGDENVNPVRLRSIRALWRKTIEGKASKDGSAPFYRRDP